jgi:hypothetical protein
MREPVITMSGCEAVAAVVGAAGVMSGFGTVLWADAAPAMESKAPNETVEHRETNRIRMLNPRIIAGINATRRNGRVTNQSQI